jgi:hypothetical protein
MDVIGGLSYQASGLRSQWMINVTTTRSALTHAMIGLLSRLFIELAPKGERQGLPLFQRKDMPELRLANLLEVLVDLAGQIGYFARLLRCHGFSFTANDAACSSRMQLRTSIHPYRIAELSTRQAGAGRHCPAAHFAVDYRQASHWMPDESVRA